MIMYIHVHTCVSPFNILVTAFCISVILNSLYPRPPSCDPLPPPSTPSPPMDLPLLLSRLREYVTVNRIRGAEFFQDFDPLRSGSIAASRFRQVSMLMCRHKLLWTPFRVTKSAVSTIQVKLLYSSRNISAMS